MCKCINELWEKYFGKCLSDRLAASHRFAELIALLIRGYKFAYVSDLHRQVEVVQCGSTNKKFFKYPYKE